MNSTKPHKFRPIFVATITPQSVESKVASNGAEYLLCTQARFEKNGMPPQIRTVMAFGQSVDQVKGLLSEGQSVELAVQFDRRTIKVIGKPRPKQIAAAQSSYAGRGFSNDDLLQACVDSAGFDYERQF